MSDDSSDKAPPTKALTVAVEQSRALAETVAKNPTRAERLADSADRKAGRNRAALVEVWNYLTASVRLLRAFARREYTRIPWASVVLITILLLYFVNPLDLVPDMLLGGLIDDAALIAFVARQLRTDLNAFLEWERYSSSSPASSDTPGQAP
ncbi:MAG: DUF1232 domain-containing protein [Candidatus Hydrogenedentes bacterium]|nr:DUF1232 domain-containing protein [Candidatus Hydrogenedentota bacterium]